MVVHYRRLLAAVFLVLGLAVPAQAQLRSPWGPQPFDDDDPPRRHSIVTVWADALDSLSHPNPLLRWHAARLAARHSVAFDDEELTRAWMRERDLRVRVALKRTLIERGKGEDLVQLSSTNPTTCSQIPTLVRGDEVRPVAELLALVETAKHQDDRTHLTFELALALRQLRNANSRTSGLHALRAHAHPDHILLLRGVARDRSVTQEAAKALRSDEVSKRRAAVDALVALGVAEHRSTIERALQTETHPDILRALLRALRRADIPVSESRLVGIEQRVQQHLDVHGREKDMPAESRLGFEVEFTRTALLVAQPHQLLFDRAQRQVRSWLSPTSPLAGLAIHLLGEQQVPLYTIAPYVDDTRSYVRDTAVRVMTQKVPATHPLRTWLALAALDSKAFEQLQPNGRPSKPSRAVPLLLQTIEPTIVAWENGHELLVPSNGAVLFESGVPADAAFCRPERTWLSFEEQIRDL